MSFGQWKKSQLHQDPHPSSNIQDVLTDFVVVKIFANDPGVVHAQKLNFFYLINRTFWHVATWSNHSISYFDITSEKKKADFLESTGYLFISKQACIHDFGQGVQTLKSEDLVLGALVC